MWASSARVNTLPVGFMGVLSRIVLVAGGEGGAQFRHGQRPIGGEQADQPGDGAQHAHDGEVGVVEGLDQDDLIAGVEQGHQAGGDGLGGAGGDHHLGGRG